MALPKASPRPALPLPRQALAVYTPQAPSRKHHALQSHRRPRVLFRGEDANPESLVWGQAGQGAKPSQHLTPTSAPSAPTVWTPPPQGDSVSAVGVSLVPGAGRKVSSGPRWRGRGRENSVAFPVPATAGRGGGSSWGGGLRTVAGAEARGAGRREACRSVLLGPPPSLRGRPRALQPRPSGYPSSVNGPGAHTCLRLHGTWVGLSEKHL